MKTLSASGLAAAMSSRGFESKCPTATWAVVPVPSASKGSTNVPKVPLPSIPMCSRKPFSPWVSTRERQGNVEAIDATYCGALPKSRASVNGARSSPAASGRRIATESDPVFATASA